MNRIVVASIALVMLVGMVARAQVTGIVGSKHDFSAMSWSDSQICKPCHIPHAASSPEVSGALWNHQLTTAKYSTAEGERDITNTNHFDSRTRLCMSCHDGTVALDSFGGAVGTVTVGTGYTNKDGTAANPKANIGTDLTNDHPVGYDANISSSLVPVDNGHGGWNIVSGTSKLTVYANPNEAGKYSIGCGTCHSTHPSSKSGQVIKYFLRQTTDNSALCQTCHNK